MKKSEAEVFIVVRVATDNERGEPSCESMLEVTEIAHASDSRNLSVLTRTSSPLAG